jgi:hypothetical protein
MNGELEALLLALDAVIESTSGAEAKRLEAIYNSRLDDVVARVPSLTRQRLSQMVSRRYETWKRAQQPKFPSVPPKA